MSWRVEYTNHPWLKKKRRKILERSLAEGIEVVERRLRRGEGYGLVLGDSCFWVDSMWLPELKKHHLAVRDLKGDNRWVATIVSAEDLTMTLEQVKSILRSKGLSKYSIDCLALTNEKTVDEKLAELEENLAEADRDELDEKVDRAAAAFLEEWLETGVIRLNDGMLDAMRKIEKTIGL